MDPSAYVRYVVLRQLDTFGTDGIVRALSAFSNIEAEANEYAEKMFASYGDLPIDGDPGIWADQAQNQGVEYYQLLSELRQGMLNLLAVGLYHVFEQHKEKVTALVTAQGRRAPDFDALIGSTRVSELKDAANTVKHADGSAARRLRSRRPDLFISPFLRGSPLERHILTRRITVENPLGGTDLFLSEADLQEYRDALRDLWERILPGL